MTPIGHRIFLRAFKVFLCSFLGDNKHILTGRLLFHQNRMEVEWGLH